MSTKSHKKGGHIKRLGRTAPLLKCCGSRLEANGKHGFVAPAILARASCMQQEQEQEQAAAAVFAYRCACTQDPSQVTSYKRKRERAGAEESGSCRLCAACAALTAFTIWPHAMTSAITHTHTLIHTLVFIMKLPAPNDERKSQKWAGFPLQKCRQKKEGKSLVAKLKCNKIYTCNSNNSNGSKVSNCNRTVD